MGIINRFLLFVYAGIVLLITLFITVFVTKALPVNILLNEIDFLIHQKVTITVLVALAIYSVYFLVYTFFVGEKKEAEAPKDDSVIIKTEKGEVRIAKEAIASVSDKEALSVMGVRESNTKVNVINQDDKMNLSLDLDLILSMGASVPAVTSAVTEAVKNRIAGTLGEENVSLNLSVQELSSAPLENQKRVR